MKELFKEVIRINQLEDVHEQEKSADQLFARINTMEMPEEFNWATDIFEALHVKDHPDKTALIWEDLETGEQKQYTYRELAEHANQLINFFEKSGVNQGDNLYRMCPVMPESWFSSLACIKSGVVGIPTALTMTRRELEYRFETYPPDVIMADEESTELIDAALEQTASTPKLKLVLGIKDGWVSYEEVTREETTAEGNRTKSDDILFCFFTSGTTGLPKRVGHTAISYPIGHLSTAVTIGIRPDDIHNNLSAPGWAKWTWSSFFAPLSVGATVIGLKTASLEAQAYLKAITFHKVTTFCAHPTAWKRFVGGNMEQFDFSSLRVSMSAGEPLNTDVYETWENHTGTRIRDFYGQTESTVMIGNPPWMEDNLKTGSFGRPCPMYDLALADNEGNEITEADQVGHIVVKLDQWRAAGLFKEYIGSPEKMNSVFVDNYYYTGDRGSFDEDGYWWFVGRADDVIKSSDYRIGPFEVESALGEHPAVAEAAVVGSPDPNRYQLVKAYIILTPGHTPSRDLALALFKHTITILPKFKIPRIIEFVEEVPKTFSGKIRRVELRQMETARVENPEMDFPEDDAGKEYFYWDFPELSSRKSD